MEFRILGVLEGLENGMPVSLGGPKQRSVLAMLLLDPNRSVSTDRLVDGLWGDEPPLRAAATLRVYVSNLRKALEPGRGPRTEPSVLLHQQPGYLLAVDPAQIDLFRFERLVSTARALVTGGCMAGAAVLFREALGLWHEAPLADLVDEPFARYEIPRHEEAHTGAMEDHIDAELALGRDVELLPDLEGLVARNPFRERLQRQLVLALYRAGRQADALAAYQAAREALVEGLGLEPSRELRELEAAILVQDPGLTPEVLAPITADEVATVLGAVNGELPSADVIARVVAEGRVSARRADEALQRVIEHERTASFTAMLESAGSTSNELVRARHLIADRVLDRRRRPATRSGGRGRGGVANGAIRGACPYKGLLAFEPEDAAWYFGRERLVAEALATVASTPCTGIVGASGSGKSSLVRAGLLAALSEDALPDSSGWPRLLFTPGADPVLELARALAPRCRAQSADHVRERLLEEPESFAGFAARAVASTSAGASLVVVVDQLEELFTVCRDEALRDRFLDVLVEGATDPDSPTRIVTAIRADYYGRCAAHAGFAALLAQGNVLVGPMSSAELQRAIEIPAARAGLELEAGLIDRIFDDVGTEPGSLPLLETALLETWANREGSTMTLAGYESSGGVRGAVAHLADDVYSHLPEHQQAVARGIFLRLAEPGAGMDDVRRRAPLSELVADDDHAAVLATLVERRLVVANDVTAEVAHEALLREWPRLRGWLEEDRAGRRVHRALAIAAQDWIASARDEALLFRGSRLAAAGEVADVHPLEINPVERDFLHASREREEGELTAARRTASRFRSLTVGLAVLLVVAIVAGVFSLVQRSSAERNASRAEQQATASDAARLMATARGMVGEQPDLALLLSLEAQRLDPSLDAETALEAVLASVPAGLERVITFDPEVRYALSSPDGRFIAAPGVDGRVRLLATDTGRVVRTLDGPSDDALAPKMSEDGTLVVAGSLDGLIRVWDAKSGRQLAKPFLAGGDGPAYGWPDPSDPTGVFTVGYDGGVARWSITDPRHPRRDDLFTIGAAEPTRDPAPQLFMVSSDGTKLLAGRSVSGPTLLWDVRRRVQIGVLAGNPAGFDSRGQVVTREGPRVTRWDASTGEQTASLDTRIASAGLLPALRPDGRYLATVEADTNRVRVLDVVTNADVVAPITLHTSPPIVRFLPDGRLLTMSSERAAIFRIDPFPAPPFARVLGDVAPGFAFFDRSGSRVLTFSATSPVGSWDPTSGRRVAEATGQPGPGELHVVSPDGRTRVILKPGAHQLLLEDLQGNRLGAFPFEFDGHSDWVFWNPDSKRLVLIVDGVPSLWNVAKPSAPRMIAELRVKGHADEPGFWLTTAAFSRDGKTTAILRHEAGIATLFDTRTGRRRGVIALERGAMPAAAFSPDGRTLAIVNAGSGVEQFDVATGKRRALLSVPNIPNLRGSITFIRDGAAFVTTRVERWAVDDAGAGSLQIWDTATLRPIGVPLPLPGIPYALSSSPDGKRLVHGTTGNFAVVWDVDVASWRHKACDIASRKLTRAEWNQYLPGRPYDPSCAKTSNR